MRGFPVISLVRLAVGVVMTILIGVMLSCSSTQDNGRTADDEDFDDDSGSSSQLSRDEERRGPRGSDGDGEAVDTSTGDVAEPTSDSDAPPRHQLDERAQRNIQRGAELVDANNLQGALSEFENALSADSNAFPAAYNIGVIRERMGQDREARESYQQALEIQADYELAIAALARMDVRYGNIQRALSFVEQRARRYNGNLPLMVTYADLLVQAERYRDAQQVARQVLRRNERNVDAMLVFAKSNYHIGRHDLALWILEQAAEIDGDNPEIYNIRGFVHLGKEERLLAIADFERAVQLRPSYAEARNNLGVQYLISGRYNDSIAQLEAARQLNPNWVSVYLNMGDAYRGAQNWSKSKLALEKALRLDNEFPEIYYNLGILYLAATKIDGLERPAQLQKSIEAFQRYKNMKASRLDEDDPVHRLLKDAQRALERERTRIERERAAAEEEARRAAAREAGETEEGEEGFEDGGDDEGWE